jgi:hypothetical protein
LWRPVALMPTILDSITVFRPKAGGKVAKFQVTSRDNVAVMRIVSPSGKVLCENVSVWEGDLPEDGDYSLSVIPKPGHKGFVVMKLDVP